LVVQRAHNEHLCSALPARSPRFEVVERFQTVSRWSFAYKGLALSAVVGVGCGRPGPARQREAAIPPRRYPSDLSDEEWVLLESLLSKAEKRARSPKKWPTQRVAGAVFYLLLRRGCSWRMLPRPVWTGV
jgi:hypothetical protein